MLSCFEEREKNVLIIFFLLLEDRRMIIDLIFD